MNTYLFNHNNKLSETSFCVTGTSKNNIVGKYLKLFNRLLQDIGNFTLLDSGLGSETIRYISLKTFVHFIICIKAKVIH